MNRSRFIRLSCHAAAELPLIVLAVAESLRGWRPLFDDAAIAWRSWDVFTVHSPLVGHMTALNGNRTVYGLGPLENWLVAIPVRIDPIHGALWGAALVCAMGIAVGVEAGWAVGGWVGAAGVSVSVTFILLTRPDLAFDPLWNPMMGVLWLVGALATSWATASGKLGWWPVAVVSASIAAQCHEVFALTAALACLAGGALGLAVGHSRHQPVPWRWVAAGFAAGVVCWSAPLIQEFTGHPGNLGLLWQSAHRSAGLGLSLGLGALGAAVRPWPDWLHIPARTGEAAVFRGFMDDFFGPKLWGVLVLAVLVAIAVVCWRRGLHRLAALAALALLSCLSAVWTVSTFPQSGALAFRYLDVVWWPVGMIVFATLIWAIISAVRGWAPAMPGAWLRAVAGRVPDLLVPIAGTVAVIGVGSLALTTSLPEVRGDLRVMGGWQTARLVARAVPAVERVAPKGRFLLGTRGGPDNWADFAVVTGVAYGLHVAGYQPRVVGMAAGYFGPAYQGNQRMPAVIVHLSERWRHPRFTVSVAKNGKG